VNARDEPLGLAPTSREPRTLIALTVAAVVLIGVAALTWPTFPLPFLAAARVARQLGLLALLCGAFVGWGRWLCRWLPVENSSLTAQGALGAIATATLWGYLAPWWFPDALLAVPWLLVGWLLLALDLRALVAARAVAIPSPASSPAADDFASAPRAAWPSWAGNERGANGLLWAAAFIFLLPPLLVALAPPVAIDSLIYHLAIPKQAALAGRLVEMPWLAYSYFPLHAEMLYALALPLGGGQLAQLLHLAAAVAAVTTAARIAARCFGGGAAPWTALLLASAPLLNLIAGTGGNDWFVALYVALALEQHLRRGSDDSPRWLEAVFLGAAVATKYTALPALVLLLLPLPRDARAWRRLLARLGLVIVVAAPWYGRNVLLRGNPIYPLLDSGPAAAALADFRGADASLLARLRGYVFEPQLVDEFPGLLLPAAIALAAILLPARRRVDSTAARQAGQALHDVEARRRLAPLVPRALLVLVVVLALPLLVAHPTARSFAPLLLLLAILGGGALVLVAATPWRRRALAVAALVVLPIHLGAIFAVWDLDGHQPLRFVAGAEDEDAYLRRSQPYVDAYRALARQATAEARVLVVGEPRVFYLERPAIWSSIVDPPPFAPFTVGPPDAPRIDVVGLHAAGVRLVFFYPPQLHAGPRPPGIRHELESYVAPPLAQAFRRLLAEHARPVFRRGSNWIFALRGDGEADALPPALPADRLKPPATPQTVPANASTAVPPPPAASRGPS
jgi:hypothetical protein